MQDIKKKEISVFKKNNMHEKAKSLYFFTDETFSIFQWIINKIKLKTRYASNSNTFKTNKKNLLFPISYSKPKTMNKIQTLNY